MKYSNVIIIAILVFSSVAFAFPAPVGFVNDFANVLPDKVQFEEGLRLYEQNTTIEVAVVTLDSVPEGYTLFSYGVDLFQEWGIGKKGEDNGILILIVKNGTTGNRLRIELGYGIQGYVTGAESGRILDEALPYYNQGDYQTTLDTILLGLSEQLTDYVPGNYVPKDQTMDIITNLIFNNPFFFLFLFFFLVIIIKSIVTPNRCPGCKSRNIKCEEDFCVCQKCGKKFKRKRSSMPLIIAGSFGGGGFGGGGFGGGGSGGGGAGR
ncbi:TPM domain-containing protein [archaeon]|nr:TPM domain-containing protein [archaeon]